MMADRVVTYTLEVHHEGKNGFWAEVKELPGCFASGHTLEELYDSLEEAVGLYLSSDKATVTVTRPTEDGEIVREQREFNLCYA